MKFITYFLEAAWLFGLISVLLWLIVRIAREVIPAIKDEIIEMLGK